MERATPQRCDLVGVVVEVGSPGDGLRFHPAKGKERNLFLKPLALVVICSINKSVAV